MATRYSTHPELGHVSTDDYLTADDQALISAIGAQTATDYASMTDDQLVELFQTVEDGFMLRDLINELHVSLSHYCTRHSKIIQSAVRLQDKSFIFVKILRI